MTQLQAIKHAAGFTAVGLADALIRATDVPSTSEATARVRVILDGLCNLPMTEGRKLLSEAVKVYKPKEGDKDPAHLSLYKTVQVRSSEARQLYGAVKCIDGFHDSINDDGWIPAVSKARVALALRGIKADGAKIETPEQRQAKRETAAIVETLAESLVGVDTKDEAVVGKLAAEAADKARGKMFSDKINAHANRIMSAEGRDYGLALADALVAWEPKEIETK